MKKHGNNQFWCFIDDGFDINKSIEIWHSLGQVQEEVMAHATDRYNAQQIVDALIVMDRVNDDPDNKLNKREVVFLSFVEANCSEPYSTMAANAIMWNDRDAFNAIKAKFNEIY